MMGELRSFQLEAALAGTVVLNRASAALDSVPRPRSVLARVAAGAGHLTSPVSEGLDHLASRFRRRADGLFVPATPALLTGSWDGAPASGPNAGAPAPRRRAGHWADAIDLDGLVLFLRQRHPTKTADHVAAETGESRETIRKWLKREAAPSFRGAIVLVCVYGPPILTAMLRTEPDWLAATASGADRLTLAGELAAFRRRIDAAIGPGRLMPESFTGGEDAWVR